MRWRLCPCVCAVLLLANCAPSTPGADRGTPNDVAPPASGSGGSGSGGAGASGASGTAGAPASTLDLANLDALFQESCATATAQASLVPANLLFVLDRSASMLCNPPPTTDSVTCESTSVRASASLPSKWEVTTDALLTAVTALPSDTHVGLSYFSIDNGCGVYEVPSVPLASLAQGQIGAVRASLDTVTPEGSTPLVGATILAYRYLHAEALAGRISGPRFVVLVTDGEQAEQCVDPTRCADADACTSLLYDEVTEAAGPGVGIRTFVVGVPGSEVARVVLSRIARAGGTARPGCLVERGDCHFDVSESDDFARALAGALADIELRAVTCELPIPREAGTSLDPDLVNVVYTPGDESGPQLVVQDASAACDAGANGWQYNADATRILLCGSICDTVRADAAAHVDVVLGCETRRPQ